MKRNTLLASAGGLIVGASLTGLVLASPSWAELTGSAGASVLAPAAGQVAAAAVPVQWGQPANLADLVERVSPSVVQVFVRTPSARQTAGPGANPFSGTPFEEFFGRGFGQRGPDGQPRELPDQMGSGSGFFIHGGYIVTNNHVVADARQVTVRLEDGRELEATVVGTDAKTDLAVIKVADASVRPALQWGDSDRARPGDNVFAVGSPFALGNTVTAGIVSARGRQIGGQYDDYIQVDAPINRGNSGGPLFNGSGQVIGVNSAIFSPTGGNVGIGFSIPADLAKSIVDQIITHGSVERGWLGVSIQNVTQDIAKGMGLAEARGALVGEVTPGSPAAKAGLKERDVILSFGERDIRQIQDLTRAVADTKAGTSRDLKVVRNGRQQTVKVLIAALEEDSSPTQLASASGNAPALRGEVTLSQLGLGVSNDGGVVISSVKVNSPGADAGLRQGDRIVMVNDVEVTSVDQVRRAVEAAAGAKREAVLLQIERSGRKTFVGVPFTGG